MTERANHKYALEGASYDLFGEYLYTLIKTNIHYLTKKFYSIVSEQDKEDLIQDIWLLMQGNKDRCKEEKNFKGWVYICCRNHFYSFARERSKKLGIEKDMDYAWGVYDDDPTPDHKLILKEDKKHILDTISKLNPDQQELAEMLTKELPYSKMAHRLDCTENNLRIKIFRLRKTLKTAV
jgi:RNA polymerase sigma factor (sigma-70 family)